MMQRQTDDFICHAGGDGKVGGGGAGQAAVGGEGGDEGIEIAAGEDALLFQAEVERIAGFAVLGGIDEDGEVGIVVRDAGDILHDTQAGNAAQGGAVLLRHLAAGGDGEIHIFEAQQAVGGAYFIHLTVDAGGHHLGFAGKTEVLEVVDALLGGGIVADEGTAFHGVVGLGGVEGEGADIAGFEDALSLHPHAEGMSGIVDDFEAVFIGDGLDAHSIAGGAVNMHGHDGGGLRGDGGFYLVRVKVAGDGIDIHKDRFDSIPPEGVGGGHEAVGRGDDLARDAQGLQRGNERQGAIREQADIGHAQVVGQGLFQLLVVVAVVGNPFALPDIGQQFLEFLQRGEKRRGDGDGGRHID